MFWRKNKNNNNNKSSDNSTTTTTTNNKPKDVDYSNYTPPTSKFAGFDPKLMHHCECGAAKSYHRNLDKSAAAQKKSKAQQKQQLAQQAK